MGLLKGYNSKDNKTGVLYGIYSHGNIYDDLISKKSLNERKFIILQDLKKAKIFPKNLKKMRVMNVGTGRESVGLSMAGAKSVEHFDISKEHVLRLKKLIKKIKIKNISSSCRDLCKKKLKKNIYDFVYLNGIVHHFSNTNIGLKNCARSVKLNGKIWVYFYRSGTFKWFECSMIRRILNTNHLQDFFYSTSNIFAYGKTNNVYTSRIMDDFFAPYIYLYSPSEYILFMEALGFKICGKDNLKSLKKFDHNTLHHSSTIIFKRIKPIEDEKDTNDLLTPKNEINQLDPRNYSSTITKQCIKYFKQFESLIKKNKNYAITLSTLIGLHKIAANQYYNGKELPPRYDDLINVLRLSIKALKY